MQYHGVTLDLTFDLAVVALTLKFFFFIFYKEITHIQYSFSHVT